MNLEPLCVLIVDAWWLSQESDWWCVSCYSKIDRYEGPSPNKAYVRIVRNFLCQHFPSLGVEKEIVTMSFPPDSPMSFRGIAAIGQRQGLTVQRGKSGSNIFEGPKLVKFPPAIKINMNWIATKKSNGISNRIHFPIHFLLTENSCQDVMLIFGWILEKSTARSVCWWRVPIGPPIKRRKVWSTNSEILQPALALMKPELQILTLRFFPYKFSGISWWIPIQCSEWMSHKQFHPMTWCV